MTAFREILRFELLRQIKRPMLWLFVVVFLTLAASITKRPGLRAEEVLFDAPIELAGFGIILGMMSLLVAAVLSGDAGARDVQARMDPLVYALPLGRADYILGRFLAAYAIHAALMVFAIAGLAGMTLQWPEGTTGPMRPASYLYALFVYVLPNILTAHALMFAAVMTTRRAIAAWGVGALLFFLSLFIPEFVGGQLHHWKFARWFDPSGYATVREYMDIWAPAQQNALLLPFGGMIVVNRAFWLALSLLVIAGVVLRFRFEHHAPRANRSRLADDDNVVAPIGTAMPDAQRRFDTSGRLSQLAAVFRFSLKQLTSNYAVVLLIAGPALFFFAMPEALEHIGVPLEATTSRIMLTIKRAALVTSAIPSLVVAFLAGELVWAERESRVHSIADAAPVPDWVLMAGKLLALLPLLLLHQALILCAAVSVQRVLGYGDHQVGLFAQHLFGFNLLDLVLFGALAVAAHAFAGNKFVGHLVLCLVWLLSYRGQMIGIEHDLLRYNAAPAWGHSDMVGFGRTALPWLWHKLYWLGWALLLLALARMLWPRGAEFGVRARYALARRRFRHAAPLVAAAAAIVLVTGGFVFWNTNVMHEHTTQDEGADRREAYEREYRRFERTPQPLVSAMTLRVELFPARGSARIDGRYALVNRGREPVDTILIATSLDVETRDVRFDRPARRVALDVRHGHHVYALERPLMPGDSIGMTFAVVHSPRGFGGRPNPIEANGAVIDYEEGDWLPRFGYQSSRELRDEVERGVRGLPQRRPVPSLGDTAAPYDLTQANSSVLDIVIGTDSAHTAVAPGRLRRTWTDGDRRWFHYTTDRPVRESWVIMSARYARQTTAWQDVGIEVLYHPSHAAIVDHVLRGARSSLAYYTEQFGPYPFGSLRFAERPGYGGGANAHPGFVDYDEAMALMDPKRDPRTIDFVFGIIAHETAHQWWGHQLTPAWVEGAPVLAESLAWYSALGAVEREFGREHLDRMLAMLRESYLTPRSRADVPLMRATDWFLAYRKGPFAMQALREYAGEEPVNGALRSLLEKHTAPGAPLPTTLDLYAGLRAATPDSLHALLHDLFAANTYWDLATDSASAEQVGPDRWRVTMYVEVEKAVVDTAGAEVDVPMNDVVEIGVYGVDAPLTPGYRGTPLFLERRRLTSGEHRIVVEVDERPGSAGVDPRSLLIDSYDGDNVVEVDRIP